MSYCGYVVEIKDLKPCKNADKIQTAIVFGLEVIVNLDIKIGDIMIYYGTDGKLGENYCKQNNLIREKDENGKMSGGYLDKNKRKIGTIKLKGNISDGLLMPIESLSYLVDITTLKVGDCITVVNGELICEKYIVQSKNKNIESTTKKQKGFKPVKEKITYPYFQEHIDTSQYAYNKHVFKEKDLCYITLKMHGCFRAGTRVKIWGEDKGRKIQEIKIGDYVVGFDEKTKSFVKSKVLNTMNNGKAKDWLKIKISRNGYSGVEFSNIECTPNHKFYVENNYIEASKLKPKQKIQIVKDTIILTKTQKSILLGLALGDGSICNRDFASKIEFGYKEEHEEMIDYTLKSLGNIGVSTKQKKVSGFGTKMIVAKTKELVSINQFISSIFSDKHIFNEKELIENFDEIALAFLYMGDGSLAHTELQEDRATIAICSFDDENSKLLVKAINSLNLYPILYKDNKGFNRLRFNKDEANKLFVMIEKYLPFCVKYKISEEYRTDIKTDISSNGKDGYVFIDSFIEETEELKAQNGWIKYDIETETHNYVVGNSLVHNSSGRTMLGIKETKKTIHPFLFKILEKFNLSPKPKKEWELVTGTRRVILKNKTDGYYNDTFRNKHHDFFKDKLQKGETVYYEIVGYTDAGNLIMASADNAKTKDKEFIKQYGDKTHFTYGCNQGQSEMYIYRMTMTNEDGYVVEVPWEIVKLRAEQMGAKTVPEYDKLLFTTIEDLDNRVNSFVEGVDTIGKTHIKEGVVIRIENKEKFTAYKHKSFNFKVLENIIKLDDVEDMEDNS